VIDFKWFFTFITVVKAVNNAVQVGGKMF